MILKKTSKQLDYNSFNEAKHIFAELHNLKRDNDHVRASLHDDYRLYLDVSTFEGFNPGDHMHFAATDLSANDSNPAFLNNAVSYNVIKVCCDTLTSRITSNKVSPRFITQGGSELLQTKAKRLGQFVEGVLYETNARKELASAFKDAVICGTGFIKVFPHNGLIKIERCLPGSVWVDDLLWKNGKPDTMFETREVSRAVVKVIFPNYVDAINECGSAAGNAKTISGEKKDLITLVEQWCLPINADKPGKHIIACEKALLFEEDWTSPQFPIIPIYYDEPRLGFYGTGVGRLLHKVQTEINFTIMKIQESMTTLSAPYVIVDAKTNISTFAKNVSGRIVRMGVGEQAPQIIVPQTVSDQMFAYLEKLYSKAFELVGISQLSTHGEMPKGIRSAAGLRHYVDLETQKFYNLSDTWNRLHEACTRKIVEVGKNIIETEGKLNVKFVNKDFVEEINLKDVHLDESDYLLQVQSTAWLPQSFSAKYEVLTELTKGGVMTQRDMVSLLDIPDVEKWQSLEETEIEYNEWVIEKMFDTQKIIEPVPEQNLPHAIDLASKFILKKLKENHEPTKVQVLREYVQKATELQMELMKQETQETTQQQPVAFSAVKPAAGDLASPVPTVAENQPLMGISNPNTPTQ